MSPSTNRHSGSTSSKETLDIVPPTSPPPPYLSKSYLYNIHNDIKSMTDKQNSAMKALNNHIYSMLATLNDTSYKTCPKYPITSHTKSSN